MMIKDFDEYKLNQLSKYVVKGKVLDIGYAQKPNTYLKGVEIYGLDIQTTGVPENYIEVKKCNLNTSKTPYKSNFFDYVIVADVLEHLENPLSALREINRILKKGGLILITTPNVYSWNYFYENMFNKNVHKQHLSWYCVRSLYTQLFFSGFKVKKMHGLGFCVPFTKSQLKLNNKILSHTLMAIAMKDRNPKKTITTINEGREVEVRNSK